MGWEDLQMTVAIFAIGHINLILRRPHSCLGLRLWELKGLVWPQTRVTSRPRSSHGLD